MRRLTKLGLSLSVVAGGMLLSAAPAQTAVAAQAMYTCPDESICLFSSPNGKGESLAVGQDTPQLGDQSWNDKARSVNNETSTDWCLYRDNNYQGEWKRVAPEERTNLTGDFDKKVSSLRAMPDDGC
ncbi:peptidase inhibitor family I36 protein [Streptomyces sp. HSW2009]|uniref:peptidase inhibitor family I36 protein n=1 Tax=Streptomyces sp. HSW2009 TaxID=3142890 RepID=UPI0032EC125E